jgi:hypothetical protein
MQLLDSARQQFSAPYAPLRMQAVELFSSILSEHVELIFESHLLDGLVRDLEIPGQDPLLLQSTLRVLGNLLEFLMIPEHTPHLFELCVQGFSTPGDTALLEEYLCFFGTLAISIESVFSCEDACALIHLIFGFYGHENLKISVLHCIDRILESNPSLCREITVLLSQFTVDDLRLYDDLAKNGALQTNTIRLQNEVEQILLVWDRCATWRPDGDLIPLWAVLFPILLNLMQNVPVADPPSDQEWEPCTIARDILTALARHYPDLIAPPLFEFFTALQDSELAAYREAAISALSLVVSFSELPNIETLLQFLLIRLEDTVRIRFATVACLDKLCCRIGPNFSVAFIEPLLAQIPVDRALAMSSTNLLFRVSENKDFSSSDRLFEIFRFAWPSFHPHDLPLIIRCFIFAVSHHSYAMPVIDFLLQWLALVRVDPMLTPEICEDVFGVLSQIVLVDLSIREAFADTAFALLDFLNERWVLGAGLAFEAILVNGVQERMDERLPWLLQRIAEVIRERIGDFRIIKAMGLCLQGLFLVYEPALFQTALGFAVDLVRMATSRRVRHMAIDAVVISIARNSHHLAIHLQALQEFVVLICSLNQHRKLGIDEASCAIEIMTVLIDVVDEDTNRRRAFVSIWILLVGTITDEFRDSKISQQATVFATHLRQRFPMEMEEALTRSGGTYARLHQVLADRAAAGK